MGMHKARNVLLLLASLLLAVPGCASSGTDADCGDQCDSIDDGTVEPGGSGPQFDRFQHAPATACIKPPAGQKAKGDFIDDKGRSCIPGILPPNSQLAKVYQDHQVDGVTQKGLNDSERRGLAAWTLFASDGKFLRQSTIDAEGNVNLLRALDSTQVPRSERFERFGVLNDPGCKQGKIDKFGLVLDDCADPYSTGIVGVRLKPNPKFNLAEWEALGKAAGGTGAIGHFAPADKTFKLGINGDVVEKHGWEVEPPYLAAVACAACHAQPNPMSPPADVDNPKWSEIVFGAGNQYFKEGELLGGFTPPDDFVHEVLMSQPPGTSDTSRVATDNIFNANVINGIANLAARPLFIEDYPRNNSLGVPQFNPDRISCAERNNPAFPRTVGEFLTAVQSGHDPRTQDGECVATSHVLFNGADSSGLTGALLRVYVNVGSCTDLMLAASGGHFLVAAAQSPISRRALHDTCSEYQDMNDRVMDTFGFLAYHRPYRLEDAPGGASMVDRAQAKRGETVFAENCATCHSSVQPIDPNYDPQDSTTWFTDERAEFFRALVAKPEFLAGNFLSDDRRYPIDLLGTNASRAYATNGTEGHIWEEFTSSTSRNLPGVGGIEVNVELPFGIDVDNALAEATGGRGYYRTPSLAGVWFSAPFLHNNSVGLFNQDPSVKGRLAAYEDAMEKLLMLSKRDGKDTVRRTQRKTKLMGLLPLPSGTPIDVFANLGLLYAPDTADTSFLDNLNPLNIIDRLKSRMGATDPVQDKGHLFGVTLSEGDKRALIEYLKLM